MPLAILIPQIVSLLQAAPAIGDAIASWFQTNPDPTPEQVTAKMVEWKAAADARRSEVGGFNAETPDR